MTKLAVSRRNGPKNSPKIRKNSSNWKEIENSSWLKLSEEFTRKTTSNWRIFGQFWRSKFEIRKKIAKLTRIFRENVKFQLLLSYQLLFDEFFSNCQLIQANWRVFGQFEAKKPTFACPPFTFAIFSLKCGEKNVGKLLILYLSHKNVFCFHFVIANLDVCLLLSREGALKTWQQ